MPQLDFELSEFEDRQRRVREAMDRVGIDLLLVTNPININYLIGSRTKSYLGLQVLFFTIEPGTLTFLTRFPDAQEATDLSLSKDVRGYGGRAPEDPLDKVKAILDEKGYRSRRIGLEVPDFYMWPHQYVKFKEVLGESLVKEATHLIDDLKLAKSPAELAYIRRASSINDAAMKTCVETMAAGKTELEVSAEIHRTMIALGSDFSASPLNFVSGDRTVYAHGFPTERVIQDGDLAHIEYGANYRRYTCTIGRVLCAGRPTARMKEVYQVVREACDAAIGAIRSGVPANVPHEAVKKVIGDAGMEEYRWHTTGYGVAPGFPPRWLEPVNMDGSTTRLLEAGMVLSIEPPIFIPEERLGARIIDNVLVTESGAEILSKFTRDLIEV